MLTYLGSIQHSATILQVCKAMQKHRPPKQDTQSPLHLFRLRQAYMAYGTPATHAHPTDS